MGVGFMLRARVIRSSTPTFLAYLPLVEADVSTSLALRVPDITREPGVWVAHLMEILRDRG